MADNAPPKVTPQESSWTKEALGDFVKGIVASALEGFKAPMLTEVKTLLGAGSYVKSGQEELEKGIHLARLAKVMLISRVDGRSSPEVAKEMYPKDLDLIEKLSTNPRGQKALGETTGSAGGFIVFPEYSRDIIPFLRDMTVVRKAGARIAPMNSNTLSLPRQDTGALASYVGESQNISKTEPSLGMIQLNARKLAALVPVSNELIRDASIDADAWVRDDLVAALAVREDLAFLRDDGSQYKPKGIRYWVDSGNITTANSTVSLANTLADLKTSIKLFKQGRKGRVIRPYWFMSTRTEQYLAHLVTGAPERFFYRDEMLTGKFYGWPYATTDQIPDNIGGASNGSELYLVDMWEAVIGENANLELAVSQEAAYDDGGTLRAAFSLDQTVIRAIARHDFALRYGKAAHILDDVRWV